MRTHKTRKTPRYFGNLKTEEKSDRERLLPRPLRMFPPSSDDTPVCGGAEKMSAPSESSEKKSPSEGGCPEGDGASSVARAETPVE